jgi:hypothetical protein
MRLNSKQAPKLWKKLSKPKAWSYAFPSRNTERSRAGTEAGNRNQTAGAVHQQAIATGLTHSLQETANSGILLQLLYERRKNPRKKQAWEINHKIRLARIEMRMCNLVIVCNVNVFMRISLQLSSSHFGVFLFSLVSFHCSST